MRTLLKNVYVKLMRFVANILAAYNLPESTRYISQVYNEVDNQKTEQMTLEGYKCIL